MRHIKTNHWTPSGEWVSKSETYLAELETKTTSEERAKYIKGKQKHWSQLKAELLNLSHQKCWYSEAKGSFDYQHVEHFRPKGKLLDKDDLGRESYWWLAFEASNYGVMGGVGNVKKSSWFPLRSGSYVAKSKSDNHRRERPLLLDPMRLEDVLLVSFDEDGKLVPKSEDDPEIVKRVTATVRICNLNDGRIVRARKEKWARCANAIKKVQDHPADDDYDTAIREESLELISELIAEDAEYSAACRACLKKSGYEWAQDVLAAC